MHVLTDGQVAPIEAMKPGGLFGFSLRRQFHLGIALPPRDARQGPELIVLFPGHPELNGAPALLLASAVRNRPILYFPGATVVPSNKPEDIHIGTDAGDPSAGSLLVSNGQYMVAALDNSDLRFFNVEDGSSHYPEVPKVIWYSAWQIALLRDNRHHETLGTIKVAKHSK